MGSGSSSVGALSMGSSKSYATSLLDGVPSDIVVQLTQFLLGSDVLRLSICNRSLHGLLTMKTVWKHRLRSLPADSCAPHAKHRYCHATSLFLRGSWSPKCRRSSSTASCDNIPLPVALFPPHRDISCDVWFALVQPANPTSPVAAGSGVLIGAQDVHASQSACVSPHKSERFAFVNANCDLHCSLLDDKPVVAEALAFHRWYHLALTYDHKQQQQCVYLNGELIHTAQGTTRFAWLKYTQLGTGFVKDPGFARQGQWSGFRGLVDEFRLCYFAWTPSQIQRLAQGRHTSAPMAYTLSRDLARGNYALGGSWLEVTCTRPMEKYVEILACWTPRLLTQAHHTQYHQRNATCTSKPTTERSLWQLMRQCL